MPIALPLDHFSGHVDGVGVFRGNDDVFRHVVRVYFSCRADVRDHACFVLVRGGGEGKV